MLWRSDCLISVLASRAIWDVRQESRVKWKQGYSWCWKYTFKVQKSMVLHCTGSSSGHEKAFCGVAWALQCHSAYHKEGDSNIPKVMKLYGTELAFSEMPLQFQYMKIPFPGIALHPGKATWKLPCCLEVTRDVTSPFPFTAVMGEVYQHKEIFVISAASLSSLSLVLLWCSLGKKKKKKEIKL